MNNYNDRVKNVLASINNIDKLLTLAENKKEIKLLQQTRDMLCSKFTEMCKDIEPKDGIKQIEGLAFYYCNGLVEVYAQCDGGSSFEIICEPFEYSFEKKQTIVPEYKCMFRPGDYNSWRTAPSILPSTVSWLINDYLISKMSKPISRRKVKYYDLICKCEKFISTFETAISDKEFEMARAIMKKEVEAYDSILRDYRKAVAYSTSGHYAESINNRDVSCSCIRKNYTYYDGKGVIQDNRTEWYEIDKLIDYGDIYEEKNGWHHGHSAVCKNALPYLLEEDVEKFIKIYNGVFNDYINTSIENNPDRQNATKIICDAEQIAKDMAYKYYIDKFETQNTDAYGKIYDGIGYVAMFMKRHLPAKDSAYSVYEKTIFWESSLYVIDCNNLGMYGNPSGPEALSKIANHHAKILDSSKTMLKNLKELYRMLYTIPNKSMRKFMVESKIISEDYYPEPELQIEATVEDEIVTC